MANWTLLIVGALVGAWIWLLFEGLRFRKCGRYLETLPLPSEGEDELPKISVVIAARNEQERIESCVGSLFTQHYLPHDVIVVDDRSEDETPTILARLQASFGRRLKVLRVETLPEGWLGKCHALHYGASQAEGDYILFTDADVSFASDVLGKTVKYVKSEDVDFLCVFPKMELKNFGEKLFALGFGQLFFVAFRPHRAEAKHSPAFVGVGAFNLIRRRLYERFGGHSLLRLTVVDDVALGKMAKYAGGKVRLLHTHGSVCVRWQKGLWGSITGVEKNAFAGLRYSWWRTLAATSVVLFLWWGPWILTLSPSGGVSRVMATLACILEVGLALGVCLGLEINTAFSLLSPLAVGLCAFALLRSAWLTTVHRGINWRGTHYPLDTLKKYDKL
ncbi:MAG: glycosyltransferase [Candidatus Sumerlaeaceae bacterium]